MSSTAKPETSFHAIGPGSHLFEEDVSEKGHLIFRIPGRDPEEVRLGNRFVGRRVAVISQAGLLAVFDCHDHAGTLLALAFRVAGGTDVLAYAGTPPVLLDQSGRARPLDNVVDEVRGAYLRCLIERQPPSVGFRFLINPANRRFFSEQLLAQIRDDRELNRLEVFFDAATGAFRQARLAVQERETQRLLRESPLTDFPLKWPSRPRQRVHFYSAGGPAAANGEPRGGTDGRGLPFPKPPGAERPSARKEPPTPATTKLDANALIRALLEMQDRPDQMWREIESNLELLDTKRTFRMVGAFPELIGARTRLWPRYKLREVFAELPGPTLHLLFYEWPLDHALALADDHPNREQMIDFLRDHEVERLLDLEKDHEAVSVDTARQLLRVGLQADAIDVKRAWRMLLGWLNADFGRREERGIHQKKDEIAKRLQVARDVLTKELKRAAPKR